MLPKGDNKNQIQNQVANQFKGISSDSHLSTLSSLTFQVLDIEFQNVKALHRRAQSFIEMGDLVSAEIDIKKALEADPENWELKSLYKKLTIFFLQVLIHVPLQ